MDKYTNTQYGLLKEPLKGLEYFDKTSNYVLDSFERHQAYLKAAIPKVEGFDDKIPLGSGELEKDVHFEIEHYVDMSKNEPEPFLIAIPLVDISKEKEDSWKEWEKLEEEAFKEDSKVVSDSLDTERKIYEAEFSNSDVEPVVSHTCTSGNSIEQVKKWLEKEIEDAEKEEKKYPYATAPQRYFLGKWGAFKEVLQMLNKEQNVQASVATEADSSNADNQIKK